MLNRYILKDINASFIAIMSVFLLLILGNKMVDILKDTAVLNISPIFLAKQILLNLPFAIVLILPLAFSFSTMLSMMRLSTSGEITVMLSAGKSYKSIFKPIFINSLIYMSIGLFLTLFLAPLTQSWSFQQLDAEQKKVDFSFIKTQTMQNFAGYGIYVGNFNKDKTQLYDVLLLDNKKDKWEVVRAKMAKQIILDNKYRVLYLENGRRYKVPNSGLEVEQMDFATSGKIIGKLSQPSDPQVLQALSTLELFKNKNLASIGQIQWRFALPLLLPLLAFPAFALGLTDKRNAKYASLLPMIIIILVSIFACFALERSVAKRAISTSLGVFWLHFGLAIFAFASIKYKKVFSRFL